VKVRSRPPSLSAGLFAVKRRDLGIAALIAVGLLVAGWFARPDTRPGVVMMGIATSVLAAVALAYTALQQEDFAQRILDLGVQRIFDDRKMDLKDELWTELLESADRHFRVLGMANHGYMSSENAKIETELAVKRALARKKTEVEFLWLNPEHQLAELREIEEGKRGLRRDTCNSILFLWELREQLSEDQRHRFSLREYETVPTCGLTWADDYLVVTHYIAGSLNLRAPGIILRSSSPRYDRLLTRVTKGPDEKPALVKRYTDNYLEIAGDEWSTAITGDRISHLRQVLVGLEASTADKQSEAELRTEPGS
jgi:hypothetical protein